MGKLWVKLWCEAQDDLKIAFLPPDMRCCWYELLMLAGKTDKDTDSGRLEIFPGMAFTDSQIATAIHVPYELWIRAREYFINAGMLEEEDCTLIVKKFAKRQSPADPTAAERKARQRERERDRDIIDENTVTDGDVTRDVTVQKLEVRRQKSEDRSQEEKDIGAEAPTAAKAAATPPTPVPDSEIAPEPEPDPMGPRTPASVFYFDTWSRKRWSNPVERDKFEATEAKVGPDNMIKAITWAAENRIVKISSICSAAEKYAQPARAAPNGKNGAKNSVPPAEPLSKTKAAMRLTLEKISNGNT